MLKKIRDKLLALRTSRMYMQRVASKCDRLVDFATRAHKPFVRLKEELEPIVKARLEVVNIEYSDGCWD